MKVVFSLAVFLFSLPVFSQDTTKINKIDLLVEQINNSNYRIERDSIKKEHP